MFNLADTTANNQVFYTKGNVDFQIWNKPANAKVIACGRTFVDTAPSTRKVIPAVVKLVVPSCPAPINENVLSPLITAVGVSNVPRERVALNTPLFPTELPEDIMLNPGAVSSAERVI